MLLFWVIFQYLWALEFISCVQNVEIELINNYITWQSSSEVTGILCWDFESTKYLANTLFERNVKVQFSKPSETIVNTDRNSRHIFILDISCNNSLSVLNNANETLLFRSPNNWFTILSKSSNMSSDLVEETFQKLDILIDSKVVLAQERNDNEFVLKYVYKLGRKANLTLENCATWIYPDKFTIYGNEIVSRTRHNLQGYKIRSAMVVLNNDTVNHFNDYRDNEVDTITKMNYVLFHFLMDYMNATRVIWYVPLWYTLTSDQNNTLLGAITQGEVDIGGTPFFCKSERSLWFKCLVMTVSVPGFFLFRQPPLSYVQNIFVLPFGRNLWLTDLAFLLISSILLYTIILWEWKILTEEDNVPENDQIHPTLADSVLFAIGAVCQQGYATEPKGNPGKILILTVFVTLIFLFTAYTAYTVVLFQATADNIKNLDDLYNSKMNLGSEDRVYLKALFAAFTDPIRRKIYTDRLNPNGSKPNFYDLKYGIEKVRTEYFAFYTFQLSGYKVIHDTFMEHEKCGLKEIKYLPDSDPYMVAPHGSAYIEIYKIGFYKIMEAGLNQREMQRRISKKPECASQGNNYRSAGLLDLYSIYMLLIIGLVSAVLLLMCEIIVGKIMSHY